MRRLGIVWPPAALLLFSCAAYRPPARVASEHSGSIRSREVAEGERVYTTLCAACHAGRVNPAGYHWTVAQMRHQIREGNALMPALRGERLSDERVEAVLAYLSTVGAIDGTLPPAPDPDAQPAPKATAQLSSLARALGAPVTTP